MKTKIHLSIMFLILTCSVFGQTVKKEFYDFKKTQIMAEYQVNAAGEKNGWFKGYNESGIVVEEAMFKNGQLNGVYKKYSTYSGKREIAQSETYKDGVLNGLAQYYGHLGAQSIVIKEGNYLNGEKNGTWLFLDGYSNYKLSDEEKKGCDYIKSNATYSSGTLIIPDGEVKTTFYPSGKTHSIQNYKGGKKVGKQTWYLPDGSVQTEEFYDDLDGLKVLYGDSAKVALNASNFELASKYYYKMKDDMTANTINELVKSKKYFEEKKYPEAVNVSIGAQRQLKNDAVNLYCDKIYAVYITYLDSVIVSLGRKGESIYQEISKNANYLRQADLVRYKDYEKKVRKEANEIAEFDVKLKDEYEVYLKKFLLKAGYTNDQGYVSKEDTYPRGEHIYTKSKAIIDEHIKSYNSENNFDKKKESMEKAISAIKKMVSYTDAECKSINKQLKKLEDESQVKPILGIQ